VQTPPAH